MESKRFFGEVPGIKPGTHFKNRIELHRAGVHLPTQAGISGTPSDGADSIVVSGGYKDDVDLGDIIIYTGHGGRDKNWKHIAHQELKKGNLALVRTQLESLPIRVIRGADRKNPFAPLSGYRYDGLFTLESHWQEIGAAGFRIWRYKLIKHIVTDEPNTAFVENSQLNGGRLQPARATVTGQRVIRDATLAAKIKGHYNHCCQVCGLRITSASGAYAEAAHIRPLGIPHNGPDSTENMLCLCPNHHTMFDLGIFSVNDDHSLVGLPGKLHVVPGHVIEPTHLAYHREHFMELDSVV